VKRAGTRIGFFTRYRDLLVVGVLWSFSIGLYFANAKDPRDYNGLDRVLMAVSAPVQWVMSSSVMGMSDTWYHYWSLVGVEEHNRRLRADNRELRRELLIRREQALENTRLRRLLHLQQRSSEIHGVVSEVIAISPSPLFRSVRVNRGLSDGVTVGAGVVNDVGIVGRVVGVGGSWADVMLLVDGNCSTDVVVQRTRAQARVRGEGQDGHARLQLEYLERTADIEPGDILVTSGVGEVFPRGMEVGQVTVVNRGEFGLYQTVELSPAVNFAQLETVMILLPEDAPLIEEYSHLEGPPAAPGGAGGTP
jgi:rod shape-determining protein MreC